jgi:hypothetical protein
MPDMSESQPPALTLAPYLTLARDLAVVLIPAPPSDEFRATLYHSLIASARQQHAHRLLLAPRPPDAANGISERMAHWVAAAPGADRRWVWGAAAVGSAVSLAGLVTFMWRRRGQRAA